MLRIVTAGLTTRLDADVLANEGVSVRTARLAMYRIGAWLCPVGVTHCDWKHGFQCVFGLSFCLRQTTT